MARGTIGENSEQNLNMILVEVQESMGEDFTNSIVSQIVDYEFFKHEMVKGGRNATTTVGGGSLRSGENYQNYKQRYSMKNGEVEFDDSRSRGSFKSMTHSEKIELNK